MIATIQNFSTKISNFTPQKSTKLQNTNVENKILPKSDTSAYKAQVNFTGKIPSLRFPAEDIKYIENLMQKCKYGKINLINNPADIKVYVDRYGIEITNFRSEDIGDEITGNCEELTSKTGIKLQEKFKDKYIFLPIKGIIDNLGMSHVYLACFENTKGNKILTDNIVMNSFNAMKQISQNSNISSKIFELLKMNPAVFDSALLIDPSFKRITTFYNKDYSHNTAMPLNILNALNKKDFFIPIEEYHTLGIPIGFAKELAPELTGKIPENSILSLNLSNDGEFAFPFISAVAKDYNNSIDIYSHFGTNHKITKFVEHIANCQCE